MNVLVGREREQTDMTRVGSLGDEKDGGVDRDDREGGRWVERVWQERLKTSFRKITFGGAVE